MTKSFLILASAAVVALSACSTGTNEPGPTTPAPSATVTDPQTTETSTPTDPATPTQSYVPAETSTPAESTTPAPDPTESSDVPDVADFTVVDSAAFLQGSDSEQLMFVSPSGNLYCGIIGGEQKLAGCQSVQVVDNLPDCDDPAGGHGPMITFDFNAPAEAGCAHEGVFIGLEPEVLEYGQAVGYQGATCMSEESGVTCIDDATGQGFTAAREGFLPVG